MSESELMLTLILFQFSHYRCFKHFYLSEIQNDRYQLFTKTLSYQRFNELSEKMMMPLQVFFYTIKSSSKGVAFIDSTPIKVCDNKRIYQHQTFKNNAQREKTTMGWFYGFKLHLIINHNAEIVNFNITTGSVSDSKVVEKLSNKITGKLYGDKGYLSKNLKDALKNKGLQLITHVRKNMKPIIFSSWDKAMLAKRNIIESVFNRLKNTNHLVNSKARSINGLIKNILSNLISYALDPNKMNTGIQYTNNGTFIIQ